MRFEDIRLETSWDFYLTQVAIGGAIFIKPLQLKQLEIFCSSKFRHKSASMEVADIGS